MVATLVGGALAAGGANAINMVVDRDIDKVMHRTRNRPLVTGAMTPARRPRLRPRPGGGGLRRAVGPVNLLSAVLAVSATAFYVFVYTLWLKRTSSQNIVIGGAAGAVPVLVGWAAVTDSLGWAPVVLFAVIFIWTPPHFWALAIKYSDDYEAAGVPMLPVVATFRRTARQILVYTCPGGAPRCSSPPSATWGRLRRLGRGPRGGLPRLRRPAADRRPPKRPCAFQYSITYLTLLFAAMAGDVLAQR